MPISYAVAHPYLRQTILERIGAGERLADICRAHGMPCMSSVNGWARRDAGFAEALRVAYLQGDARRALAMDEDVARALVARLAAGERLGAVLADPAMPTWRTFRHWRAVYGWFGEAVHQQMQVKAEARRARMSGRYRPYDPVVGERLYLALCSGARLRPLLASDRAFPSRAVLARWRRESPAFGAMITHALNAWRRKRARARTLCTPQMTERVVEGLLTGGSLRSLSLEPGMPSRSAMYDWVRTRSDFAEAVAWSCDARPDWYADMILEAARATHLNGARETRRIIGQLSAQETRLRKRPGWKRRRDG